MKIHLYQIIIICISSVMLFQGVKDFFKRETGQTFLKLSVRIFVWGGMGLVAVYPDSTMVVARFLGVQGHINAVILTGFVIVFLVVFKLLSEVERIEKNLFELTRNEVFGDLPLQSPNTQCDTKE